MREQAFSASIQRAADGDHVGSFQEIVEGLAIGHIVCDFILGRQTAPVIILNMHVKHRSFSSVML